MNVYKYIGFIFAVAALASGISGIFFLFSKPDLPFKYDEVYNSVIAVEDYSDIIKKGDIIDEINGTKITDVNRIEFLCDMMNDGDETTLKIKGQAAVSYVKVRTVKAYGDYSFILISSFIGLTFWSLGLFVFIKRHQDFAAKVLYIMLILFAVAIMTSPGKNNGNVLSYYSLIKVLHLFAYTGGISLLIHFSLVFPKKLYGGKFLLSTIYIFFFTFCCLMNYVQLKAVSGRDTAYMDLYHELWTLLIFALLSGTVWAAVNFGISFFSNKDDSDRRKVQWTLWGILMGVMPYLFFWVIPNLLDFPVPIKEEYSIAFFIFIPVSFVISVLKYKLFDIEFLFSKSIVYFTMTLIITGIFFLIVHLLSSIFSSAIGSRLPVYSLISAIFVAIIFNPLRIKIQQLVDKYFFRVKYDFRNAVNKCNAALAECNTTEEIGKKLLSEINDIIPSKKSAILLKDETGEKERLLAARNADNNETEKWLCEIDAGGFAVSVPLMQQGMETGKILLGVKLSGVKYLDSDLEILRTFASNAVSVINRIELREKIIKSEIEKKRLEELSNMKSEFVSSVSHELKTPLTSIQMFAETLMSGKQIKNEKLTEYAEIIYGESERLTRMINNILDFSKIERGIKQYYFENISLKVVLEYVLNSMEYQFKKNNARIIKNISRENIIINADRDAVAEAVINLLSNALKYSGENPVIEITLDKSAGNAILSVKDNGKGIEQHETEKIFDKFYRAGKEHERHIGGAGIGLSIVKNIMSAHGGEIKVISEPGRGSTFSLSFKTDEN